MMEALSSIAEDTSPRGMRLDIPVLGIEARAEVRRRSTNFATQLFYLLIGGVLPIAGVLWIMAHSP
jgi:hypothetical protein